MFSYSQVTKEGFWSRYDTSLQHLLSVNY